MPAVKARTERTVTPAFAIVPTAVYTPRQIKEGLELKPSTVSREIRLKRLRVARRGGKHLILGSWVLEWVASGELIPDSTTEDDADGH
jgi:hypothetical protein